MLNTDEVTIFTNNESEEENFPVGSCVISEKLKLRANDIYCEFEKIRNKFGPDALTSVMPLVVNTLEALESSYLKIEDLKVERELYKEDNEQFSTQFERERSLRQFSEKKFLELEDCYEAQTKEHLSKIESLESLVRMLELKAKLASDQVSRLEDKEKERTREYNKLHERYNELFLSHMDLMERRKMDLYSSQIDAKNSSVYGVTRPASTVETFGDDFSTQDQLVEQELEDGADQQGKTNQEFPNLVKRRKPGRQEPSVSTPISQMADANLNFDYSQSSRWNMLNLDELVQDNGILSNQNAQSKESGFEEDSNGCSTNITNSAQSSTNQGDVFTAVTREVEILIQENNELLETKNALNIVKDDLIAKVDELTSEQEILREEISSLQEIKQKLKAKNEELESETKSLKSMSLLQKSSQDESGSGRNETPLSQRKRFTRVEMARVLMERNSYKEKLLELQDAVRWSQMLQATRHQKEILKKSANYSGGASGSIWNLVSSLFSFSRNSGAPRTPAASHFKSDRFEDSVLRPNLVASIAYSEREDKIVPGTSFDPSYSTNSPHRSTILKRSGNTNSSSLTLHSFHPQNPLLQSSQRVPSVKGLDDSSHNATRERLVIQDESISEVDGRFQAYGWSLPNDITTCSIAVPVYCKPIDQLETHLICATVLNLTGGETLDGGSLVGDSVFYSKNLDDTLGSLNPEEKSFSEQSSIIQSQMSSEECDAHNSSLLSEKNGIEQDSFSNDMLNLETQLKNVEIEASSSNSLSKSSLVWICGSLNENGIAFVLDSGSVCARFFLPSRLPLCICSVSGTSQSQLRGQKLNMQSNDTFFGRECEVKEVKNTAFHEGSIDVKISIRLLQPTVWISFSDCKVYVYPAVCNWSHYLGYYDLPCPGFCLVSSPNYVVCGLSNGALAVFTRSLSPRSEGVEGTWMLSHFHILATPLNSAVRCVCGVSGGRDTFWFGCENKVLVFGIEDLSFAHKFLAHPQNDNHVSSLVTVGDGVWMSIRLDSIIRLFHAHTFQHLQDVDVASFLSSPIFTPLFTPILLTMVRVTALHYVQERLWIGLSCGLVLSMPIETKPDPNSDVVTASPNLDFVSRSTFLPLSSPQKSHVSFHGHADTVAFIVSARKSATNLSSAIDTIKSSLVTSKVNANANNSLHIISGGQGYVDFRINLQSHKKQVSHTNTPHTIIWQL